MHGPNEEMTVFFSSGITTAALTAQKTSVSYTIYKYKTELFRGHLKLSLKTVIFTGHSIQLC